MAARLVQEAHTLGEFRRLWVDPPSRKELIDTLVTAGYSPSVVRMVDEKQDYDLYDVLAELGWGMNPRMAGLAKLRLRQCHREPLTKSIGDGLFELRHVGKLNTRILWFFMKGRRIIAVHGIRNKGRAIPTKELETARTRMHDWQKRFST